MGYLGGPKELSVHQWAETRFVGTNRHCGVHPTQVRAMWGGEEGVSCFNHCLDCLIQATPLPAAAWQYRLLTATQDGS